jgi:murein DD-endopeptidase MepM/ murein hydrolase activator NlpD
MKKIKYFYNTQTLRYEKLDRPLRARFLRWFSVFSALLVFALLILWFAYTYLDSPKEKQLKQQVEIMQEQYALLNQKLDESQEVLSDLRERDNNIYRVIFEAEPEPSDQNLPMVLLANQYKILSGYSNSDLMSDATHKLDNIRKELYVQSKSYDELGALIKQKNELLSSIPAIEPISGKQLQEIGSGFGMRIDPIYKIPIFHPGLDFVAAPGTPIHATGDGVIETVELGYGEGYGNHVVIQHGFGYETLYGHMLRVTVHVGQHVKRGDVIGTVGSTGRSTGPHCHYEVIKNGVKINPISFFFNDLTPTQYDELVKKAAEANQTLD